MLSYEQQRADALRRAASHRESANRERAFAQCAGRPLDRARHERRAEVHEHAATRFQADAERARFRAQVA